MSRFRQQPHPWLADHVIFFCYRWLAWSMVLAIVLWQGSLDQYGTLLVIAALVNMLSTVLSQPYVRIAARNPAVLSLDLLYTIPLMLSADGWNWPFLPYALSSLVVPGLLFGWRGGLMSGLSFASLNLAVSYALGRTPTVIVERGSWAGWVELGLVMIVPPLFGLLVPSGVELLRNLAEQRSRRARQRTPLAEAHPQRDEPPAAERFIASRNRLPDINREPHLHEAPLAAHTTTVRATDHIAEEARRVLFAPLTPDDLELPAALDALAVRFKQHTGAATRVSLLGRTRYLLLPQRLLLIRLAQEALLNVQQHAHAHTIELTLRFDATSVALMIQDDGVGLLDGTYERPGLHALRAMQYRLAEFGGRLDVFESEAGGVTVRATVPLDGSC